MIISYQSILFSTFQGPDLLEKAGGLHKFMNWNRALLTVSIILTGNWQISIKLHVRKFCNGKNENNKKTSSLKGQF